MPSRILSTLPGIPRFQSGIGDHDDLFVRLQQDPEGAWFPVIRAGTYFLGTEEGYFFAQKATATFSHAVTGGLYTVVLSGQAGIDPTTRGPIRLLRDGSPRPLQRVSRPLRAYRTLSPRVTGDLVEYVLPASGVLVSLCTDPTTGLMLSVPGTGDIIATDEYTYEPYAGKIRLKDAGVRPLYATYLAGEEQPHLLRQEEILRVSRDGLVRVMWGRALCVTGSATWPVVRRPRGDGALATVADGATGNVLQLAAPSSGHWVNMVLRDGPFRWYRFDETSGAVLVDHSGSGRNGALTGVFTRGVANGRAIDPDGAVTFDGSSGRGDLGVLGLSGSCTLEAWIKHPFVTQRAIFSNQVSTVSGVFFGIYYGKVWFLDPAANFALGHIGEEWIADDRWHHVVVTSDGATVRSYVDGRFDKASPMACHGCSASGFVAFGQGAFSPLTADELILYNRCLTEDQILDHYELSSSVRGAFSSGDIIAARYYVADSFTARPSGSNLLLEFIPSVSGSFTVEYETGSDQYFPSQLTSGDVNWIQLNPLLSARESGFLYLCDSAQGWPQPGRLTLDMVNRNPLYSASGFAAGVFAVTVYDVEEEPLPESALVVTVSGVAGTLARLYPPGANTDGRGQARYSFTPTTTGVATITARVSGTAVSGVLTVKVRPLVQYSSGAEERLGKLLLALESTPYRENLRRLAAYYCYRDGTPFQPDGTDQRWTTTVTFSASRSRFYGLDGQPLAQPVSIRTSPDMVALVLVDAAPGDRLRAEVQTPTPGRVRTAPAVHVPDAPAETE
jgi:hypothetical protein